MKLRNIQLENQALNAFVYTPFYHDVTHSSHAMSTYGSTASTASHFTVSSGSGGGFSGGGGGGGLWCLLSSTKNGLSLSYPSSLEGLVRSIDL